jgi:hypothetical protein
MYNMSTKYQISFQLLKPGQKSALDPKTSTRLVLKSEGKNKKKRYHPIPVAVAGI